MAPAGGRSPRAARDRGPRQASGTESATGDRCTRAARSGPRPTASAAAPTTSRLSRRTGTTSAPPTTGLAPTGRAEAAWLRARRLDPRGAAVRRALALTPPADVASARWIWSPPVTPEELLLIGGLGWIVGLARLDPPAPGAGAMVGSPRFRGCGGHGRARDSARGIGCRWPSCSIRCTLRLRPHGRAPALAPVEGGSAVRLVRRDRRLGARARARRSRGVAARRGGGRDRRIDCRHDATHRHPARRRRRPDRRGRGRRAPGLGGEGAGRERARRRRPPCAGRRSRTAARR